MSRAGELARRRQALMLRGDALRLKLALRAGELQAGLRTPVASLANRVVPIATMVAAALRAARLFRASRRR